ncbi:MAG: Uma2 family endonuclease [Gemmataceae bacterium]
MSAVVTRRMPPLQNGDRLTRVEFERRWLAMPHLKKAELINGVVYVAAALRFDQHGGPHFNVIGWLAIYTMSTPGVLGGDNSSLRLDDRNEPQPDAFLMIAPDYGGQAAIDGEGYVTSGPELIVEVAASSASYDLHDKLDTYRRHRVREYVVWRVLDQEIDWFVLRKDRYQKQKPTRGIQRSSILPGLWLDVQGLIKGDMPRVAEVARRGIETKEHAGFAARLQQAAARKRPGK